MSVWVCIPSARPAPVVAAWAKRWTDRGYKIALWRDDGVPVEGTHLTMGGAYPGYSVAANELIRDVLARDSACDWVVCCGDDTWPDPNHMADEIAETCNWHFGSRRSAIISGDCDPCGYTPQSHTFGVMQPTGDDWKDAMGRIIERIAGSPWIGREFALRVNGGQGAWWPEYRHNWADQELQEVATKLGCFWQRRDLIHYHDHCMRMPGGTWAPHLAWVSEDYRRLKPLFNARQKMGFPGSAPL